LEPLDLQRSLEILGKRWLSVFVVPFLLAALMYAYESRQPKQYEATAILIAGQGQGIAALDQETALTEATQSLGAMVNDRVVVAKAAKAINVTTNPDTLQKTVAVKIPANTQKIILTVTSTSPSTAERLVNSIADTFSQLVKERAAPQSNLSTTVWQRATKPTSPSGPRIKRNVALAFIVGLLLGMGLAFLREFLDRRWRSDTHVEQTLGIPVLALIPDTTNRIGRRRVYI
jgi:capsular polysaccharide biosynthesis protein